MAALMKPAVSLTSSQFLGQSLKPAASVNSSSSATFSPLPIRAGAYTEELIKTAVSSRHNLPSLLLHFRESIEFYVVYPSMYVCTKAVWTIYPCVEHVYVWL